jgi:nicotinic acid phosphoribosyltransferase
MGYVIAGLLVVLIIAIGVTVLVMSSRRHGRHQDAAAADAAYGGGVPGSDTAMFAAEPDTPLGDTAEHAGEQRDGETVGGQDEGAAPRRPARDGAHTAPPVTGGEGEGRRRV